MSKIRIEAFFSSPPGSRDDDLANLLQEIGKAYSDRVEIIFYKEHNKLYEEYNLTALPAVIVGELIRFIGIYPDRESLTAALKESGLN